MGSGGKQAFKRSEQNWTDRHADKRTDIATYRLNRPKGRFSEKKEWKRLEKLEMALHGWKQLDLAVYCYKLLEMTENDLTGLDMPQHVCEVLETAKKGLELLVMAGHVSTCL